MGKARAGEVDVSTIDGARLRKKMIGQGKQDPNQYLRFLVGHASIDHDEQGIGNAIELVKPGQSKWKWKWKGRHAGVWEGDWREALGWV